MVDTRPTPIDLKLNRKLPMIDDGVDTRDSHPGFRSETHWCMMGLTLKL